MVVHVNIGKDLSIWTTRRYDTFAARIRLASKLSIGIVTISVHDDPRHVGCAWCDTYGLRNALGTRGTKTFNDCE